MRLLFVVSVLLAGLALILVACGSRPPTPTPTTNEVNITLTTNPDPPAGGNVELIVTVSDAQNQPIDNAQVFVFANHANMSGMTMDGQATAQGNGRHAVTANLGMGGRWEITVQVDQPSKRTIEEFTLEVE